MFAQVLPPQSQKKETYGDLALLAGDFFRPRNETKGNLYRLL